MASDTFDITNIDDYKKTRSDFVNGNIPPDTVSYVAKALHNWDLKQEAAKASVKASTPEQIRGQALLDSGDATVKGSQAMLTSIGEGARRLPEDAMQLVLTAGNTFGTGNEEKTKAFNAGVQERRTQFAQDTAQKYGQDLGNMSEITSGLMLGGTLSATGRIAVQSYLRGAAARAAIQGGVASGMAFDPNDIALGDKKGAIALGALFPSAVTSVLKAPGAFRNLLARRIADRADPQAVAAANNISKIFTDPTTGQSLPQPAVPLLLGDITGDPTIKAYQRVFQNVETQRVLKERSSAVQQLFQTARDRIAGTSFGKMTSADVIDTTAGQTADKVFDGLTSTYKGIKTLAETNYQKAEQGIYAMAAAYKQKYKQHFEVPITNLTNTYLQLADEMRDPGMLVPAAAKQQILDNANTFLSAASRNGRMNIDGLLTTLRNLKAGASYADKGIGGANSALEVVRKRLLAAAYKDLGTLENGANPDQQTIIDKFRTMNSDYSDAQDSLRRIRADGLYKAFGKGVDVKADPQGALDRFLSMNPSAQKFGIQLLNDENPNIVNQLKSHLITTALAKGEAAGSGLPHSRGTFDVGAFQKAFYESGASRSGLFSPQELAWAKQGADYFKSIAESENLNPGLHAQVLASAQDIGRNVISRSFIFMSGLASKVISGSNGERLFTTPEGIAALREVRDLGAGKRETALNALNYLMTAAEIQGREIDAQKQQAAAEQAKASIGHVR